MKKHIPNVITLLNLLCGSVAIVFALNGNVEVTHILIGAALLFDFLDGLAARVLKAYSEIGKQLDSLADLISFGVAPAFLVRSMLLNLNLETQPTWVALLVANLPLLLIAATAYRLARFNIDNEQGEIFKGLPAPANAMFWLSFVYFVGSYSFDTKAILILTISGVFLMMYQLVSTVPMFSLKFKNLSWQNNEVRYSFILISIIMLALLKLSAFFVVIWLYIMFSSVQKALVKN